MIFDTVDAFCDSESSAWKQFLATGSVADLNTWRAALSALNSELETRVAMLLARGRAPLHPTRPDVRNEI